MKFFCQRSLPISADWLESVSLESIKLLWSPWTGTIDSSFSILLTVYNTTPGEQKKVNTTKGITNVHGVPLLKLF